MSGGLEPEEYIDSFGNHCGRVNVPVGMPTVRITNDALIRDSGELDEVNLEARQHDPTELPFSTLQFLLPSRYCEVDSELLTFAWNQFGGTPPGWPRVRAICTFVHQHLKFNYKTARPTRTALDAFREKEGVCRDFTHLAITLCRCMNIPARYTTGYLGDIGVPPCRADGLQRLVRGLSRRPLVHLRRAPQHAAASAASSWRAAATPATCRSRCASARASLLRFDVVTDEVVEPKAAAAAAYGRISTTAKETFAWPRHRSKDQVQGEGDYDAGRRYDKASREFAESGKVEPAARDAAPDDAREAEDMERAEAEGKSHAKGEDPLLNQRAQARRLISAWRPPRDAEAARRARGGGRRRRRHVRRLRVAHRRRDGAARARQRGAFAVGLRGILLRPRVDERDDRRQRVEQREQRRRAGLADELAELERDRRAGRACRGRAPACAASAG